MNQIKIIFFDIDGTLVDMQTKQISTKTIEALQRLKAKGDQALYRNRAISRQLAEVCWRGLRRLSDLQRFLLL